MEGFENKYTILRNWLVAGIPVAIMLILTLSGFMLHTSADRNHQMQSALVAIQAGVNKLNSLQWKAIAKGRADEGILSEFSAVSKDIRLLKTLQRKNKSFEKVLDKYNLYEKYLIIEMKLLNSNQLEQAQKVDQLWVDSVFSSLEKEIDNAVENQKILAKKQTWYGYAGFLISFMLAVGTAMLFYLQYDRHRLINKQIEMDKNLKKEMARLERLNLIGEMAASIGHEIRNPMTTVRGFLQIMSTKREFMSRHEEINLMIEELDRANLIIKEYLNLANNKAINLQRNSINGIVTTLYPLIKADAMLHDKNVTLELGEISELYLDEQEIRQLLLNLARNGLEAMSNGGNLKIKTWTDKNKTILSVSDQGKGIDSQFIDKVGTPFFTTKDEGTGLGLAVCYSIAARHDASIRLETGNTGTVFHVEFTPCTSGIKKVVNF